MTATSMETSIDARVQAIEGWLAGMASQLRPSLNQGDGITLIGKM